MVTKVAESQALRDVPAHNTRARSRSNSLERVITIVEPSTLSVTANKIISTIEYCVGKVLVGVGTVVAAIGSVPIVIGVYLERRSKQVQQTLDKIPRT